MNRRQFLSTAAAVMATPAIPRVALAEGETSLLAAARAAQARAYVPNTTPLAAPFADLTYDAFRGIRPRPGASALIPHGDRFAVDLLPPGLFFTDPVTIDRVGDAGPEPFSFRPDLFAFDPRYFTEVPSESPGAGFTGMRLRHPINAAGQMDEVLVIQGASYFRAVARDTVYGLSARALAVGTGGPVPEEFPRITHLRLHPATGDAVRIEGLIDSPSLAGHVEMTLRPGEETEMDIAVTLLPRVAIADIGVAPLTSMYLKGPMLSAVSDDFRPRVHDSDVLVIENGAGEVLWRPIANPRHVETSAFGDAGPRRFGLYQTARSFAEYQDTEARYHDRPSAHVTPLEDWGPGAVMLVEIPTGDEFMDNIVAFWRPAEALAAGSEHRFAYRLTWTRGAAPLGGLPRVLQSRSGREHDRPGHRRFVVDFDGPGAGSGSGTVAEISASEGAEVSGVSAFALPEDAGTRVTFLLAPGARDVAELRLSLSDGAGAPRGPVWLHRWTRARDGGV